MSIVPIDMEVGVITKVKTSSLRIVKELYPRPSGEDNAAIERYRAAIDRLPPVHTARDGIIVDGFHRWQAHKLENIEEIEVIHLGNLADIEILKESLRRNSAHGHQIITKDKKTMAATMYTKLDGTPDERYEEISALLSIQKDVAQEYCRDARRSEVDQQKANAWDLWLDCVSTYTEIARQVTGDTNQADTIKRWISAFSNALENAEPPTSRQHFDIWQFAKANGDSSYFGKMPPQVVENLLWFYTKPGDIVFDPFVGGGTTITIGKEMGRRVWASDIKPITPMLPIHEHNILNGWPGDAPNHPNFILLDPPYWQQAKGKYSNDSQDFGNMTLEEFYTAWAALIKVCASHISNDGSIAYIISPTQREDGSVIDHATDMLQACWKAKLKIVRRIIVPYSTQQANGQQVKWAQEQKRMLKLYRDLIILKRGN